MVNPAVTPAFRKRLFAWLLASCTFSIFAFAQPTPVITGETAVCQGDVYFYATTFTPSHTWAWTLTPGGDIVNNFGNYIEVRWNGPQNSNQTVSVVETDAGGLTGSDAHTVSIIKSILTCDNVVQVSIDQDGVSHILPDNLLEGTYNTYEGFRVEITNANGFPLGDSITCAEVGKTLTGKVMDDCSGNSCWSIITVEDKLVPVFSCPNVPVEIPCDADLNAIPAPLVFDNCDDSIVVTMVGYHVNNSNICNGVWIDRTWTAVDNHNNYATCIQRLHISPNGPVDFPKDKNWTCTQYDQYPHITDATPMTNSLLTTGSGTATGVAGPYCQYNYLYNDDTLLICGNSFKIIRTWAVINWCTGAIITTDFEGDDNEQVIAVMDNNKPSITVPDIILNANLQGVHPFPCTSTDLLPAPTVADSCNDVTVQIFTAVGEAVYVNGVDGKQGGYVPHPGLKIGLQIITYKVTDACGNSTSVDVVARVTDLTAPVNICVEYVDVNLEGDGFTEVFADAFDLASYDNCCIDRMEVKRMGAPDSHFAPSIEFTCDDVPEVMVVLRVYDCFDNYNDCMVTAHVNDKVAPLCIAPQMKIIACTDLPADITQAWLEGFGDAAYFDNCEATLIELPYAENINACGEGHIIRYWKATDNSGNISGTCEQHIYTTPASDWVIKFPADFFGSCEDIVDADSIEIDNFGCDMFATTFEDQYFALTLGDSACYKIVRTWKVINWCNYDPYATHKSITHDSAGVWIDEEDYNNFGAYTYQQIIKIYDDTPPVLSFPYANVFCSDDADCQEGGVYLPIVIDGVCSNNYQVVYHIDFDNDNDYDLNGTGFFEGTLPVGKHRVLYLVEDGCNNEGQLSFDFEVKDCKKPTAVCENGLIVELMQTGMVPVCVDALDYGSYDNCPGELTLSFSPNVNDTCLIFNCLDLGVNPVNLWVTDADGNQDFCSTFVVVQDNMFSCANGAPLVGRIATLEDEAVEGVEVMLNSNAGDQTSTTNADGIFNFAGNSVGEDYTVTPSKDDDPANGVTTFDLVLISKHILGSTPLGSPYKIIAADANRSNSVTTFDLVEIRKLILHMNDDFPNNTSWRFVENDYQFPNPANPWAAVFPEFTNINDLSGAMSGLDFNAIKIGDVNNSATANGYSSTDLGNRSSGTLTFEMDNHSYQAGDLVTATFKAGEFINVYGFQFTIDFNKDLLSFKEVVPTTITSLGNFGTTMTDQGAVTTSWETNPTQTLATGTEIITLKFMALAAGSLSEAISISSRFTVAEAYVGDPIEVYDVALNFNNGSASAANNGIRQGYKLYQNVPNPFSKHTVIGFQLPIAGDATLTVYDALGKKLTTINGQYAPGYNEVEIDRNLLPSEGLLYYRLESGSFTSTRSMTIIN